MPYASKAQHRLFRALEARRELPRGTASRWYHETPAYGRLPERVGSFGYYSLGQTEATQAAQAGPTPPPLPPPLPAPTARPAPTFLQRHGTDILVGTITAVTGALAVYFAMRYVGRSGAATAATPTLQAR